MDVPRRDCAISVLGGPTTVVDIAGRRIVMDPTFDPPGAALVIPAHVDGWAHFSEGTDEFVAAFDQAGISGVLGVAAHGEWIDWVDPSTR
jgi:L-ascorbate metabolism protein UlaG (beta-lactamase superfamily)